MERRERERVVGYAFPPQQLVYTDKDVILYAHGIGATEPWYLYEHYRHGGGGEGGNGGGGGGGGNGGGGGLLSVIVKSEKRTDDRSTFPRRSSKHS